jgi:signal transduction histidine kinase
LRTIIRLNRFRRLYEQRARFEAAITYSPDGVVLAEFDGTIIHRNPTFSKLLDPAEPARDDFYAYLPADAAGGIQSRLARPEYARAAALPTSLNLAKKTVQAVEVSHSLIPWEGRSIVLYTIRDVTEKKMLEQQLLHSQRIELLGQLAGSAIHDLNNILSVIAGSAQLIEMKGAGVDCQPHIDQITQGTQRSASMLRQLLMFARGEDGELELANPTGVAAEVANMVKETFGKYYPVDYHAAENLPPVLIDSTQIHQIVMNLCVNARDAMPEGGRLTIAVERRKLESSITAVMGDTPKPGDYVTISVRDTGTGIPPEILPKLFDPFFTTKPKGKGTGLGLATVIRLVRRHQGFVTLDTEVGKGTCFTCHFPAKNRRED